ncbi:MAG: peptide transporter permease, partial [Frondihabitans sp.]|nr:peptide transporter permease [Frondihabitans sp.]
MTTTVTPADRRAPLWKRLPVIAQLRTSVGLQRGMLIAGIIITLVFIIAAIFAPLIAPYGYAQLTGHGGAFPRQAPPSATHIWGTTVGGFDVFSRVVWGARTAISVVILAV